MKFTDFNTKSTIAEEINIEENEFIKLAEYVDKNKTATVKGFFFTDGDYGKQVVAVTDGYNINMPTRCVEMFEAIAKSDELLETMKNGKAKIGHFKKVAGKNGRHGTVVFDWL